MVVGDTAVTVPFSVGRSKSETSAQYSASDFIKRILVGTSGEVYAFAFVVEELAVYFKLCIFIFSVFLAKTYMTAFILGFLIIAVAVSSTVMKKYWKCFLSRYPV